MPISHFIDEEGILRVKRSGAITTQLEDEALAERQEDSGVIPGIRVLVDCTEVDPPDTTEVIRYLANRASKIAAHLDCGPVAIVVTSDVAFGMARMYQSLTELAHEDTRIFRDQNSALAWLRTTRTDVAK